MDDRLAFVFHQPSWEKFFHQGSHARVAQMQPVSGAVTKEAVATPMGPHYAAGLRLFLDKKIRLSEVIRAGKSGEAGTQNEGTTHGPKVGPSLSIFEEGFGGHGCIRFPEAVF